MIALPVTFTLQTGVLKLATLTKAPGVPVKVNVPAVPEQTVFAVKVAVGKRDFG